jgi:hypothetical protein
MPAVKGTFSIESKAKRKNKNTASRSFYNDLSYSKNIRGSGELSIVFQHVFFAMAKKMPMLPFRTENGGNIVSAGTFPPDLFRTIDPCHGSIIRKRSGAASQRRGKTMTIHRRAHGEELLLLAPEVRCTILQYIGYIKPICTPRND